MKKKPSASKQNITQKISNILSMRLNNWLSFSVLILVSVVVAGTIRVQAQGSQGALGTSLDETTVERIWFGGNYADIGFTDYKVDNDELTASEWNRVLHTVKKYTDVIRPKPRQFSVGATPGGSWADGFDIGYVASSDNTEIWNTKNGFLQFGTNDLERMMISPAGNISINGAPAAGARFTVNGNTTVTGTVTGAAPTLDGHLTTKLYVDSNDDYIGVAGAHSAGGNINMGTHNITSTTGNIGIGTAAPDARFHVQNGSTGYSWTPINGTVGIFEGTQNSRAFVSIVGNSTAQSELLFGDEANQLAGRVRYEHDTNNLELWANGGERMSILSNGNVAVTSGDLSATTLTGDLVCTDCINATEVEDIYLLNTSDSVQQLTFTDSNAILWENGVNRITHNDGAGNVQIRMGHDYSSSDELFTHAGTAFYIGGNLDTAGGALSLKVASNGGAGNNTAVTWGPAFTINSSGATTTGTITGANFIGPGTGLTGTAAGLSIGGNAATATNVAWTGITGKPAGFADDTDDYIGETGTHTSGGNLNMSDNSITNLNELKFYDAGSTEIEIRSNGSGLIFDGGDGNADMLVYDNDIRMDRLRLGYSGTAQIITDGTDEDLTINPNGIGEVIVSGNLDATSFSGAGTGLTGTAAGLSIGGNAATATNVAWTGITGVPAGFADGTDDTNDDDDVAVEEDNVNVDTSVYRLDFGNGLDVATDGSTEVNITADCVEITGSSALCDGGDATGDTVSESELDNAFAGLGTGVVHFDDTTDTVQINSGSCAAGSSIRAFGTGDSVTCETDDVNDTVSESELDNAYAGMGTGVVYFDDTSDAVSTATASCAAGSSIRAFNASGVTCETDDGADNLGNHTATQVINHTSTSSFDKIRVWNSSSYTIGMASGQSYGGLNDYAMTFTMNNDSDRGWLWRDTSDSNSDGAMSLTTGGTLQVKGTATAANFECGNCVDSGDLADDITVGVLRFETSNHKIDSNSSGLLFDGGDGTWDFLVYDNSLYTDVIRTGYTGAAQITTYDTNESLLIDPNGTGGIQLEDNVGINTTPRTDSYRLSMGGNIHMNNYAVNYTSQLHFNDNVRFYDEGNDSYLIYKYGDAAAGGIKIHDGDDQRQGYLYASGDGENFGLLDADGNWGVRIDRDTAVEFRVNNAVTMRTNGTGTYYSGGAYLDDDSTFGEHADDWIRFNGYIEMKSNTDSYGIVLRDKDNTNYLAMTQVGGYSYLTDSSSYTNYFIRGNGDDVLVRDSITADDFIYSSDRRLKENIKPVENALETILQLDGVHFDWKKDGSKSIGFIAQDVEKLYPELVDEAERETGEEETYKSYKTLAYANLVAPIVEAIKELYEMVVENLSRIVALEQENAELREQNEDLMDKFEALEARLNKLEAVE